MEVSCRLRLFSVWLTFVFVAGCTGGASVPRPTSPGPQESATQLVPALTGATLLLPSGASVLTQPQSPSSDQTLSFVRGERLRREDDRGAAGQEQRRSGEGGDE